ncbi:MAG TPA: FecR domain-containing protein [Rhizomicrobium sp.]|jgi:transmembrane sensor|nr:FecR domain-containing protein [Rhizomicrobium sp.]
MDGRLVMHATRGIHPETKVEAAAWLVRLHADDRSQLDEDSFRAWLSAKPENGRAFEAVTTVWDLAEGLRARNNSVQPPALRRRSVLAAIGTIALAGTGFAVWQEAYAGVYETQIGEQKHVTLSDGTRAFLDTDTRLRERFTASLRAVDLDRGMVDFRIKPDAQRPFMVDAAGQRVLADRTTFDVRRDGNRVSVVLLDGQATVLAVAQTARPRLALIRGERAIVAANLVPRIDKPNLAPLVAWQAGQAMFESESLLAAAAEMNRYSTTRLVVNDAIVAKLRLSGVYRVGDNIAFARSVSQLLPVIVEHYPDHIELVRDESRMPEG